MNYQLIHDSIIEKARSENRMKGKGVYYEAHHIVPKCMGGEGHVSQWKNNPNIILLTAKEHFVVHKLLCEIYPNNDKLKFALFSFVNGKNKYNHKGEKYLSIGSKEYERIRIECAKASKKHFDEIERTKEWSSNISKSKKGKPGHKQTEEWKLNHSKLVSGENHPMYNKKHNEESKNKMSIAKKGKYIGSKNPNGKKIINTTTGEIYDSLKEVATILNISRAHLCRKINPTNKTFNNTPYEYL